MSSCVGNRSYILGPMLLCLPLLIDLFKASEKIDIFDGQRSNIFLPFLLELNQSSTLVQTAESVAIRNFVKGLVLSGGTKVNTMERPKQVISFFPLLFSPSTLIEFTLICTKESDTWHLETKVVQLGENRNKRCG